MNKFFLLFVIFFKTQSMSEPEIPECAFLRDVVNDLLYKAFCMTRQRYDPQVPKECFFCHWSSAIPNKLLTHTLNAHNNWVEFALQGGWKLTVNKNNIRAWQSEKDGEHTLAQCTKCKRFFNTKHGVETHANMCKLKEKL